MTLSLPLLNKHFWKRELGLESFPPFLDVQIATLPQQRGDIVSQGRTVIDFAAPSPEVLSGEYNIYRLYLQYTRLFLLGVN